MTIEIAQRAAQQIERAKRWWLKNRPYAQELFDRELHAAFEQIRTAPNSGHEYHRGRQHLVRRILMPQTRNHVYYRVINEEVAQVVTLWGAIRGRGPRL